jgi:hypothetical protein
MGSTGVLAFIGVLDTAGWGADRRRVLGLRERRPCELVLHNE